MQRARPSDGTATEAFAPCAKTGARDYSALVRDRALDEGVHIIIDATDDDVTLLGPDVKERDAVIVYPKGKGQVGVEVPLMKTQTGYHGDKIVLWDDLGKLTDDGTKIDVAIYDHDKSSSATEEMHLALAVSTGKSCEKAQDENMQTDRHRRPRRRRRPIPPPTSSARPCDRATLLVGVRSGRQRERDICVP